MLTAMLLIALVVSLAAILIIMLRNETFRARATAEAEHRALNLMETWQQRDLSVLRTQNLELSRSEANVQLQQWKLDYEQTIRQDAVRKSQGVTLGKITEHFVPYLPDFAYKPADARFLGSPIDFIVFDGLTEGEVRSVVFVEVKTGKSALTSRERRVRDAVEAGRIEWLELRLPTFGSEEKAVIDPAGEQTSPALEALERERPVCGECGAPAMPNARFCTDCGADFVQSLLT
jgi:predicted Holliday junction resolvase-like endonuclease